MVFVYDGDANRKPEETINQFIYRICMSKNACDRSWKEVASICNKECGQAYSETWYRKNHKLGKFCEESTATVTTYSTSEELAVTPAIPNETEDELDARIDEIKSLTAEMHAERVKLQDERTSRNVYRRLRARDETIVEIAKSYAETMAKSQPLTFTDNSYPVVSDTQGILLLSDWHYGMVCENAWNIYDPSICKQRVTKLLNKIRDIVRRRKLETVTVLNLGDLIAGRIHSQIRIESRYDVITQTMNVAEILAQFSNELSKMCTVKYYDCLDNHSRIEPNKAESLDVESLARIIPWYLVERLRGNDNFEVCDNRYSNDIITCKVNGHNIIGVHGDNDNPATALEKLSLLTHQHYDLLCTAHRHHFQCDEQHQSMIVGNASLIGVDNYSEKLRLTSHPSQTFITVTEDNVCECIYRILLD